MIHNYWSRCSYPVPGEVLWFSLNKWRRCINRKRWSTTSALESHPWKDCPAPRPWDKSWATKILSRSQPIWASSWQDLMMVFSSSSMSTVGLPTPNLPPIVCCEEYILVHHTSHQPVWCSVSQIQLPAWMFTALSLPAIIAHSLKFPASYNSIFN